MQLNIVWLSYDNCDDGFCGAYLSVELCEIQRIPEIHREVILDFPAPFGRVNAHDVLFRIYFTDYGFRCARSQHMDYHDASIRYPILPGCQHSPA